MWLWLVTMANWESEWCEKIWEKISRRKALLANEADAAAKISMNPARAEAADSHTKTRESLTAQSVTALSYSGISFSTIVWSAHYVLLSLLSFFQTRIFIPPWVADCSVTLCVSFTPVCLKGVLQVALWRLPCGSTYLLEEIYCKKKSQTVLCNSLELPFMSLFSGRKINQNTCKHTQRYSIKGKNWVCTVLMSLKMNI